MTFSQFAAETMCLRQARAKGTELPNRFWEANSTWKKEFLKQIRFVNSLLKVYSEKAIARALRTHEGRKVYSLGATWLDPLLQAEQDRVKREAAIPEPVQTESLPPRLARPVEKTKLGALREIDG